MHTQYCSLTLHTQHSLLLAVSQGAHTSHQCTVLNIQFLLTILEEGAGNVFLHLADTRQIERTHCSWHTGFKSELTEVSSDSDSCHINGRYTIMHANNETLACFPSNACVIEDHDYRTTGSDRLKKKMLIFTVYNYTAPCMCN